MPCFLAGHLGTLSVAAEKSERELRIDLLAAIPNFWFAGG